MGMLSEQKAKVNVIKKKPLKREMMLARCSVRCLLTTLFVYLNVANKNLMAARRRSEKDWYTT